LQDGWLKLSDFFGKHSRDCVTTVPLIKLFAWGEGRVWDP
jgi:hypothetical protein